MAILTNEVKVFITQALACHDTPSQVAESVFENFGIKMDRMQVQRYDPTKAAGATLAKKYVEIFHETRKRFLADVSEIPISNQSFRLRALQSMYEGAKRRNNFVLAKEILEQAAKEVGNFYTNRHLLGSDPDNPFVKFLEEIGGSSLPVVKESGGRIIDQTP